MITYGITAINAHLNVRTSAFDPNYEIDWQAFKNWNNNKMPQFAGRYFLGQPYLWGHGEAIDVFNVEKIPMIVPIQKADKERQEAKGNKGERYGYQDANAICSKLMTCFNMKELSIPGKYITVFLEVETGTKLSEEYWAAWCSTLIGTLYMKVIDENILGSIVPMLSTQVPFLPCIYCNFTKNAAGKYVVDADVKTCLDNSGRKKSGKFAWCRGFWAHATDIPEYHTPEPPLDWTKFEIYNQPQGEIITTPVPVYFWRYFDSTDPEAPVIDPSVPVMDQFDKFTLDAVATGAVSSMCKVEDWKLSTGENTILPPTHFGLDRGSSLKNYITALTKKEMKLIELPSTYVLNSNGLTHINKGVDTGGIKGYPTFVGRYYTGRPIGHRDLNYDEALKISQQGAAIVIFFQGKASYNQVPNYLLTPNQGKLDALAAFSYATKVIGQPAYTPIYFAIDADVNSTSGLSVTDIERYFSDIKIGYDEYLKNRRTFILNGATQIPTPGAVYTNNGASWTVIFSDMSDSRGKVECWRSLGTAEPTTSGTLMKTSGTGDVTLTFSEMAIDEAVPYYIGVYSSWNVMDALYSKGLADYFWQAWPFNWGERTDADRYPNIKIWPHANLWQVLLAQMFSVGHWSLPENKKIIEAAGGLNVGLVKGTDGNDYLCINDHTSSIDTKPVTGSNYSTCWVNLGTTTLGTAWTDTTAYKSPSLVKGTDGNDYLCINSHTSSTDTKPITGSNYSTCWINFGTTTLGTAWTSPTAYKSGKGPVDLNIAWGDTGGWIKYW